MSDFVTPKFGQEAPVMRSPIVVRVRGAGRGSDLAQAVVEFFRSDLERLCGAQRQQSNLSTTDIQRGYATPPGANIRYTMISGQEFVDMEVSPQLLDELRKKPRIPRVGWLLIELLWEHGPEFVEPDGLMSGNAQWGSFYVTHRVTNFRMPGAALGGWVYTIANWPEMTDKTSTEATYGDSSVSPNRFIGLAQSSPTSGAGGVEILDRVLFSVGGATDPQSIEDPTDTALNEYRTNGSLVDIFGLDVAFPEPLLVPDLVTIDIFAYSFSAGFRADPGGEDAWVRWIPAPARIRLTSGLGGKWVRRPILIGPGMFGFRWELAAPGDDVAEGIAPATIVQTETHEVPTLIEYTAQELPEGSRGTPLGLVQLDTLTRTFVYSPDPLPPTDDQGNPTAFDAEGDPVAPDSIYAV